VHIDASVSERRIFDRSLATYPCLLDKANHPVGDLSLARLVAPTTSEILRKTVLGVVVWRDVVALLTLVRLRPRNDFVLRDMQPNRVGLYTRPRLPSLHHHAPYCAYSSGFPPLPCICLSHSAPPTETRDTCSQSYHDAFWNNPLECLAFCDRPHDSCFKTST
jgi:hypothetical protein